MARIPFGVERLDDIVGGGAPPGSVVLLVGEGGAGAREFLYTSAAMNGLAQTDPELFELYYGDAVPESLPGEVHYVSFTTGEEYIEREMANTMAEEVVESALPAVTVRDLSPEYFQLSPVPRSWYAGEARTIADLGDAEGRESVLSALGTYLSDHAAGNLVLIDSVTDLVAGVSDEMRWNDIAMVMKGLEKAANRWGGLVLLLVNGETLTDTELGSLADAASGTFEFAWESGGSKRARTMVVKEFRGVLSRLEQENIVQFETEIGESGFDISDVRKIR
ncbi:MAG: HTR-like protein [Haloferacaceae archaeon]|jgi:KaiC/GvpD/RAD55 family RecA-like ATPase